MRYRPYKSPLDLKTPRPHWSYPARWELIDWYVCTRKFPFDSLDEAQASAVTRTDGDYHGYPCPTGRKHFHVGRGAPRERPNLEQARRTYRKSVRDELWRKAVEEGRVPKQGPRVLP
jgi:hypothetical protein